MLEDSVCLRAISSSSKSVTVVPSSTFPKRLTMPASDRMAAASCVFPDELWPTRATFLMPAASYTFIGRVPPRARKYVHAHHIHGADGPQAVHPGHAVIDHLVIDRLNEPINDQMRFA